VRAPRDGGQPVRAVVSGVHGRGHGQQDLGGADVARGLLPADVLLAGLQREPVGRIWENLEAPDQERLLRELEDAEQVLPVHFAFHYSNLAFALLGQIVELLEARPWGDVVTERILAPLEMRSTGLVPEETGRALGYQVHPHTGVATLEPRFDLKATAPLGGLWSTVADLGRYASFVADPIDEILASDTLEEMCRPLIMTDLDGWARAYGLGYDLQRIGERVLAGHGGAAGLLEPGRFW